jgi:HEAT repeat protein
MFGPKYPNETKEAIPALIRALRDDDQEVRSGARAALKAIDPDAARKAGVKDD